MIPLMTAPRPNLLADSPLLPQSPPSSHPQLAPENELNRGDYLQATYLYRGMGWSVFPLYKKAPAIRGWRRLQERRPRDEEITRMFDHASWVDGVAAVTGQASLGLCVRDFDTKDGYIAWAQDHPDLAGRLPTVKTGRGYHVYIRLPKNYGPIYKSWKNGPLKGEILGTPKRYVVLPPSRHPSGTTYQWLWGEPFTFQDLPVCTPEELGWLEDHHHQNQEIEHKVAPPKTTNESNYVICSNESSGQSVPLELVERDAVMKCLPSGPGERNDCLWALARTLKSLPHLSDADEAGLWPHFEIWFSMASAVISTKSMALCWADFKRQWKLAKVSAVQGFDGAMTRALAEPSPAEAERYEEEAMKKLVAVCVALQKYAGEEPFFLSCRTAQRICGFGSFHTAARRLNQLVEDGLLVVVWMGKGGTDRRRATRYRWLAESRLDQIVVAADEKELAHGALCLEPTESPSSGAVRGIFREDGVRPVRV
jgi:hypothetical protein